MTTSKTEYTWPVGNPLALVFYFNSLNDEEYGTKIANGVNSETFVYDGGEYYLTVAAQGCTVKDAGTHSATGLPVIKVINAVFYF